MILAFVYLILVIGHQLAYAANGQELPAQEDPAFVPFGPAKTPSNPMNLTSAVNQTSSTTKMEVTSETSVSPRIERLVLKELNTNYNVYPRPNQLQGQVSNYHSQAPIYTNQPVYSNWSNQNGTAQWTTYNPALQPFNLGNQTSCYRSLNAWREDQRRRINSIFNTHRKNGSYIVDFRIQKPNGFIAQSLWSFLPDGAQLYFLRQKELKALNLMTDVQKRPCCYNNIFYDCVYPAGNSTVPVY